MCVFLLTWEGLLKLYIHFTHVFCNLILHKVLDREGQGHWAVVYKSHFPATKAFIHSETQLYT